MNAYLTSVVGIVLLSGIVAAILPEGKSAQAVKGTAKLCCLFVILSPIAKVWKKGGDTEKFISDFFEESVIRTDETFIEYCRNERVSLAEELIEKEVLQEFGKDCTARLFWSVSGDEIKVEKVEISGVFTKEEETEMAQSLQEKYGCEVAFGEG